MRLRQGCLQVGGAWFLPFSAGAVCLVHPLWEPTSHGCYQSNSTCLRGIVRTVAQGSFLFSKRTRNIPRLPCRG